MDSYEKAHLHSHDGTGNGTYKKNNCGMSQSGGVSQSGTCFPVLSNPHGMSIRSEDNVPMEEEKLNMISHPRQPPIGNNTTTSRTL